MKLADVRDPRYRGLKPRLRFAGGAAATCLDDKVALFLMIRVELSGLPEALRKIRHGRPPTTTNELRHPCTLASNTSTHL
jgi:hypothetical protein